MDKTPSWMDMLIPPPQGNSWGTLVTPMPFQEKQPNFYLSPSNPNIEERLPFLIDSKSKHPSKPTRFWKLRAKVVSEFDEEPQPKHLWTCPPTRDPKHKHASKSRTSNETDVCLATEALEMWSPENERRASCKVKGSRVAPQVV